MNNNDIASIINSRAFAYLIGTLCILVLFNQASKIIKEIKGIEYPEKNL